MGNTSIKRSGADSYLMKLSEKNKIGEGSFGAVYKIETKDKRTACAVKFFKIPFQMMSDLE